MVSLLGDDLALLAKHRHHINFRPIEHLPDLGQSETDEFQRHDLLQTNQISIRVEAIARGGTSARFEQSETVVVVQRADRNSGPLGKFVRLIGAVHCVPTQRFYGLTLRQGQGNSRTIVRTRFRIADFRQNLKSTLFRSAIRESSINNYHFAIMKCGPAVAIQISAEVVELADTPSDAITLAILYKLLILQLLPFASITSKELPKDGQ